MSFLVEEVKKKGALYKSMSVYLWVVLLTLVPIFVLYNWSANVIHENAVAANRHMTEKYQNYMDGQLANIERVYLEISQNKSIRRFIGYAGDLLPGKIEEGREIGHSLGPYKTSNMEFDDVYIYCMNSEVVLSGSGINDRKEYYNLHYFINGAIFSDYLKFMLRHESSGYYDITRRDEYGDAKEAIAFVLHLTIPSIDADAASLVFIMDKDSIERRVGALVEKDALARHGIINSQKKTTIFSNAIKDRKKITDTAAKGQLYTVLKTDDGEGIISLLGSSINDWVYAIEVPSKYYYKNIRMLRFYTLLTGTVTLLAGLITSYFVIKKKRRTIRDIMCLLEAGGIVINDSKNEFDFIKDVITNIFAEREGVQKLIEDKQGWMRDSFLTSLLKGRTEKEVPLKTALSTFNMSFDTDYFAVCLYDVKDISPLFAQDVNLDAEQRNNFLRVIMSNVIEELTNVKHRGYMTEYDDTFVCIINLNAEEILDFENDMKEIFRLASENIKRYFGIDFVAAASGVRRGEGQIPTAYKEARYVLEHKKITGMEGLTTYVGIAGHLSHTYYYPAEQERKLLSCIKLGDEEKARSIIRDIFYINLKDSSLPVTHIKSFMTNLVSTLIKGVNMTQFGDEREYLRGVNRIFEIIQTGTVEEMKTEIFEELRKICALNRRDNQSPQSQLVERAKEYIMRNFNDPDLNATVVASALGANLSYLSTTFKDQVGEGLLSHINGVRIHKAKDILREKPSSTIEHTAQQVGFSNTRTFSRVFKNTEGIAPSEFREVSNRNIKNGE